MIPVTERNLDRGKSLGIFRNNSCFCLARNGHLFAPNQGQNDTTQGLTTAAFQVDLGWLKAALVLGFAGCILRTVSKPLGAIKTTDDAALRHLDLAWLVCAG